MVWEWWHTPVIPVLRRERWEDQEFKASFSYTASSKLQEAYLKKPGRRRKMLMICYYLR